MKSEAMRKCPKCGRNSLGYNTIGQEQCIYNSCAWINTNNINLDSKKEYEKIVKALNNK